MSEFAGKVLAENLDTLDETGPAVPCMGNSYVPMPSEIAVYITWGNSTSAGAVQLETSDQDDYAGAGGWAPLGSPITWVAANKKDIIQITGRHGWIRLRVSTAITGGTVSARIVGV